MERKLHNKRKIYTMPPRKPIYEGKAKQLFEGPEPGTLIQHFKDDATAFNNVKKGTISGKGVLNNRISEYLMLRLHDMGIPTHFIRTLNMREQLIKAVQIVPLEIIVRNCAAGSFAKRFGVQEGKVLGHPLIEYCFKNDALGDPFVTEDHIFAFGWATPSEIDEIRMYAFRINDILSGIFMAVGIRLADFKLEFGRLYENEREQLVLADEISPDNCRLWDSKTGQKLDKDRFRQDLGQIEDAYREVAKRLGVLPPKDADGGSYVIQVNAKMPPKKGKPKLAPKAKAKTTSKTKAAPKTKTPSKSTTKKAKKK
jgi:phosphoribosylaminoimidazole-succinocarboxamide synthase